LIYPSQYADDMTAVTAHDVARVLRNRYPGLPDVKLHKLLYYCQGVHLAHCGEPLFRDSISAWDMGPVVTSLWHREKDGEATPPPQPLDEAQLNTVEYVLSHYGSMNGRELATLTHNEDPWLRGDAERKRLGQGGARIKEEWIQEYFSAALAADSDEGILSDDDILHALAHAERWTDRPARPDNYDSLASWASRRA
jgi:uncharacterized phage-associated protein